MSRSPTTRWNGLFSCIVETQNGASLRAGWKFSFRNRCIIIWSWVRVYCASCTTRTSRPTYLAPCQKFLSGESGGLAAVEGWKFRSNFLRQLRRVKQLVRFDLSFIMGFRQVWAGRSTLHTQHDTQPTDPQRRHRNARLFGQLWPTGNVSQWRTVEQKGFEQKWSNRIPGFVSFLDETTTQMLISFLTSLWPPEKTESDGAGAFRAKIIFPAAMGTVATGHNLCSTAGGPPLDSHFFFRSMPSSTKTIYDLTRHKYLSANPAFVPRVGLSLHRFCVKQNNVEPFSEFSLFLALSLCLLHSLC